ncbi:hypothetical protein FB384_002972 [Prauserella sediminis]|uniref:Uncharacterized protein n=1 Tax=Prauserella sediminis TaxID=577680 RepID=A0A839XSW0_9PSEU|nr:hypothetical protein [Prauserella sediminis]MBB3664068.1 hypothetical protein [Prauserella sediminis]
MSAYTGDVRARRRRRWPMVVAVSAALLLGVGIGIASVGLAGGEQAAAVAPPAKTVFETVTESAPPNTETVTESVPPVTETVTESAPAESAQSTAAGEPEGTGLTMGMYQVGVDTPPGRYVTDGPDPGDLMGCYWERTRDDSGEFESVITNGTPMGKASVTVEEGEFFNVDGSCMWFQE